MSSDADAVDLPAPADDAADRAAPADDAADRAAPADEDDPPPDGSTLLGATGVEVEVLAEAARAEAELANPETPPPDDEGAQV